MDKDELDDFIKYYRKYYRECIPKLQQDTATVLNHIYQKFGCEFIHRLPTTEFISPNNKRVSVVSGASWIHSVIEPAYYHRGQPKFCILNCSLPLDQWLQYSALSPEERIIFKLKYG
jgi:hypothetical protein